MREVYPDPYGPAHPPTQFGPPSPSGIVARDIGTDAAGRREYRYHERWRARRDAEKFDRMIAFADALPALRRRVTADLGRTGLPFGKAPARSDR